MNKFAEQKKQNVEQNVEQNNVEQIITKHCALLTLSGGLTGDLRRPGWCSPEPRPNDLQNLNSAQYFVILLFCFLLTNQIW